MTTPMARVIKPRKSKKLLKTEMASLRLESGIDMMKEVLLSEK